MRLFRSFHISSVGMLLAICATVIVSCSPATSIEATPTSEPPTGTQTATVVPSTATLTASATPSATLTPTSSSTATAAPTDTPTPEPTDTPPPTATRAPTRRPTDTPAPVAAAPAPACPAWYQPPQPGKGVFLIVNEMQAFVTFDNMPGRTSSMRIDGAQNGEPTRLLLQLDPGQYVFNFGSEGGSSNAAFSIAAGERKMLQFFMRPSGTVARGLPWLPPIQTYQSDRNLGAFDIPYGCPGGVPPTPTPAPQCPAWFATPAPDKAVLVVENRSNEPFDLIAPDSGKVVANVPRTTMDGPGHASVMLAPGHYEFEVTTGKQIVVDLAGGASVVAVHPETRQSPALLPLYGLTPPLACPGHVPPTPPPPPQCPAWFQQPQPGKGVLTIENHISIREVVVTAVNPRPGMDGEIILRPQKDNAIDRRVLQLSPGHYEFDSLEGGFTADISERQMYVVALVRTPWGKRAATTMTPPPGCP